MLKTKLIRDEIVDKVCKDYTYEFKDIYEFDNHVLDNLPEDFGIGLIVGTSGSGKSILLKDFGKEEFPKWEEDKAVCSHFETYEEATEKLMASGFNSIPQWLVPYDILSTGQKYRVNLARTIKDNAVFDEFTSVIDRYTSLSLCNSVEKYIRNNKIKGVVFASVHKDIIEYLQPDWVYDTDEKTLTVNSNIYDIEIEDKEVKYVRPMMEIKF